MSFKVTPDTIIGDILDHDMDTAPYFFEIGMHCLGCPASRGESIADACAVHGTDVNALVEKLNEHFAQKGIRKKSYHAGNGKRHCRFPLFLNGVRLIIHNICKEEYI